MQATPEPPAPATKRLQAVYQVQAIPEPPVQRPKRLQAVYRVQAAPEPPGLAGSIPVPGITFPNDSTLPFAKSTNRTTNKKESLPRPSFWQASNRPV